MTMAYSAIIRNLNALDDVSLASMRVAVKPVALRSRTTDRAARDFISDP